MRLSWYADTGVAVFSIWQGGTCTGTFRLPIADLPRMIEALQRGPHGEAPSPRDQLDSPQGATEPHGGPGTQGRTAHQGAPGHEAGHGSGQYDPGDYGTGEYGSGDYGSADFRSGDYRPELGEYGRAAAPGSYEETRAVRPGDSHPGGYRGEHGDSYEDEPTGVYRGGLLNEDYRDEHGAGYRDGRHREDPRGGEPQDDPLAGGYTGEPVTSGYRDGPRGGGYREGPRHGGGDWDDGLTSRYDDDPLAAGHHDGPRGGDPDDGLTSRYDDDQRSGGHRRGQHGGAYPDGPPARGEYPGDPRTGAHPEDWGGGYPGDPATARYPADPLTGDYPTGPPDPAIGTDEYAAPPPSGNPGYSPARPYVAPLPGGAGRTPEGRRRRRGRPAGGEESDPSPDSFPYGRPPAEPEVPGHGR
jgi:hypothetical protein